MRNRWLIAVAWLAAACSDSHGARVADDMSASGGRAGSGSALPMQPAVPAGDRDAPRDPSSMVGPGMTPPAEAPRDPDLVDRPRDPSVPPPASEDAPAQPPRDPDLPSSDVGETLLGHWFADGQVGDCISLRDWYSFAPDGTVINRAIDHNACSGVRLASESLGRYAISSRELEITLAGPGSERPFDMAVLLVDVAERIERFTYAIGERPATVSLPAETFLDAKAFRSIEGKGYDAVRTVAFHGASDELLFEQEARIHLRLEPGLPAAVGAVLTVFMRAELSQLDTAVGMPAMHDTIELEYPVVVRNGPVWHPLEPTAFAGLSAAEANLAWQALLDDASIEAHPTWAQRLLQSHFFPSQRYDPNDPLVLSSTLPDYGRWTRSADAPPVPANTP